MEIDKLTDQQLQERIDYLAPLVGYFVTAQSEAIAERERRFEGEPLPTPPEPAAPMVYVPFVPRRAA